MYDALGGTCEQAIGPLQENQVHAPMELYWPEGQQNMMEKIDQIQLSSPLAVQDNLVLDDSVENANFSSASNLKTIKGKIDALSNDMQNKVDVVEGKVDALSNGMQVKVDAVEGKVDAVESKVDAVESKVDAVEGKVDTIQDELKELKDMMSKLMRMMAKK